VLAFGAGTLIGSVAYELVPTETQQPVGVGLAIGLGALVFYFGDSIVKRMGGEQRKDLDHAGHGGVWLAIALGTVLDRIQVSSDIGLAIGGSISVFPLCGVHLEPARGHRGDRVATGGRPAGPLDHDVGHDRRRLGMSAAVGFALATQIGSSGELVRLSRPAP
jgi:hypothetical protein